MKKLLTLLSMFAVLCLSPGAGAQNSESKQFDVVIKNARVVDGTGNPWFKSDIGVKDGRIARIGFISEAEAGRVVAARVDLRNNHVFA